MVVKTQKLKSEIIYILPSQNLSSGNVQVILLKFKWPPQIHFLSICDRKNSNLIYDGGMIWDFKPLGDLGMLTFQFSGFFTSPPLPEKSSIVLIIHTVKIWQH